MANTNGTVNGTLIAQRALQTLLTKFPILRAISKDLSADVAKFGQTINAHIVTAGTADDYSTTLGYVPAARTQVNVPVTINKHKHHTYAVNDQERSSTDIDLIERYADTAAHALGSAILADLFALYLNAAYANKTTVAAASFGRDDLVTIAKALNSRDVTDLGRFMVLNPDYYAALFNDSTVISSDYSDGRPGQDGKLPRLQGFDVSMYSQLPANGESLTGIAGVPESSVWAARLPEMPQVQEGGRMEVVTEPNTGLSVLLREFYNWRLGQEERTVTLMYGVAVGVANNLQRITSA